MSGNIKRTKKCLKALTGSDKDVLGYSSILVELIENLKSAYYHSEGSDAVKFYPINAKVFTDDLATIKLEKRAVLLNVLKALHKYGFIQSEIVEIVRTKIIESGVNEKKIKTIDHYELSYSSMLIQKLTIGNILEENFKYFSQDDRTAQHFNEVKSSKQKGIILGVFISFVAVLVWAFSR